MVNCKAKVLNTSQMETPIMLANSRIPKKMVMVFCILQIRIKSMKVIIRKALRMVKELSLIVM